MAEGKAGEGKEEEDSNCKSIKRGSNRAAAASGKREADVDDSDSDSSSDDERMFYKIVLLGDGAVGKTSIAPQFANGVFAKSYKQTVDWTFCQALGSTRRCERHYTALGYWRAIDR